jgi:outer membrane protein assembly factor BamB
MHAEKYVHPARRFYDSVCMAPTRALTPERPMRFEIVVAPSLSDTESLAAPEPTPAGALRVLQAEPPAAGLGRQERELLDVFVDGANVTARVHETHGALVLRDLSTALVELSGRPRSKAAVRFYDEPWEMCIERFGSTACLSVYRAGPEPQVAVYDRAVAFGDIVSAARDALEQLLASARTHSPPSRAELASALEQLRLLTVTSDGDPVRVPEAVLVAVEPERDAPLSFGADLAMRDGAPASDNARESVERADLHAMLMRGRVRAEIRGRAVDLGECHPLLVAERLVELARRAFDAWERGLPMHARGEAAGIVIGIRLAADDQLALSLGRARPESHRPVYTFPALGVVDVLEAALAFGRSLVRAVLRRDRAQADNLRLMALRRALREGTEALREAAQTDSKVNPTPGPYRAFAATLDGARSPRGDTGTPPSRLRYAARWRAIVPGIDLRATYLCGDRLVVGATSEMWALDRASGRVLWRVDVPRATSVVTPGGIARLAADGTLAVHDLGDGEITLRARLAPRVGGPVAGAVVHLPGLPKLLVVTEGEHHLAALDLTSGEPRWRWSWGGGKSCSREGGRGAPRLKRAGRLLYVTCGDGSLTALDVMTGSVVWRLRDRLRFRTPPTLARDALLVVAGGAHGVARLYCMDPYSGAARWSTVVAEPRSPCTIEGAPLVARDAVGVAVRQKSGHWLASYRLDDGTPLPAPRTSRTLAPTGTSWLAIDDAFIGNTPTGELLAVGAGGTDAGELLWRHVLGPRPLEADVPRRLEPVLRCGALFVPHADVAVLRPRDGALLGSITGAEAIPDLLRVDESCNVYVAEESGHLVAFGALPRLELISRG